MSDRQRELYQAVRYSLETSMEPSDADKAVVTLDALVQQVKADVVKAVVVRLTEGLVD
jgi:hypothetical protein